jgi:tRNA G26 N,N-dimethylase Trm1
MREGNVVIGREGAFYSELQTLNRELSSLVMREYFLMEVSKGKTVSYLDLFCGTGIRAMLFCDTFPNHGTVIGVDNSSRAIETALQNREKNGLAKVEFLCQDVRSLDLDAHPLFDVIEMDPFGGCLPYLEKYVASLSEGGLLNLTFTNSRELHPTTCDSEYSTHGIPRPHPDIGLHEFGLRSTWLAVSKKAASLGRYLKPICCWSFQHGCRIMAQVTRTDSLQTDPRGVASLYTDFENSFALVFPASVTEPSLDFELPLNSKRASLRYLGGMWGGPLIEKELVLRMSDSCASSPHLQLFLRRLLKGNSITRSGDGSAERACWGIYSRKKFLRHYSALKSLPSLQSVCLRLNELFPNCAAELAQDRDAYLVSPSRHAGLTTS